MKQTTFNRNKIGQLMVAILPFVALIVLFALFVGVVSMKGYRLDMYLKIVFNEALVLTIVATGATYLYPWNF